MTTAHEEVYKKHRIRIEYDSGLQNPFEEWDWPKWLAIVHKERNCTGILDGDLTCDEFNAMLKCDEDYFNDQYGEDVWISEQEDSCWILFHEGHEGDSQVLFKTKPGLTEEEAWEAACCEFNIPCANDYYYLPVYKFEHSGVAYNTKGFSCPWDSGQIGYIYISIADAVKEGWKDAEAAEKYMEGVIETWSQWASGEVYGFITEEKISCTCGEHSEWEEIDSCWGFYGDYEAEGGCLDEAKSSIDWHVRNATLNSLVKETMYKITLSYNIEIIAQYELTTKDGKYCFFWGGYRYFDGDEIVSIEDVGF